MKKKKIGKFLFWSPRVLAILFILFLSLFSLDVFDMKLGFWGIIVGLLMHNIPSFFLIIILVISWKHEIVGGIAFCLAGALYITKSLFSGIPWYLALSWSMIIAGPAILTGVLFLIGWFKKKK